MPDMRKYIFIFLYMLVLAACGQKKTEKSAPQSFPEVVIPGMLSDAQDRADWLALNYWNRFAACERSA